MAAQSSVEHILKAREHIIEALVLKEWLHPLVILLNLDAGHCGKELFQVFRQGLHCIPQLDIGLCPGPGGHSRAPSGRRELMPRGAESRTS